MEKKYYILDGRAYTDPHLAVVCEVCNSLEEARNHKKDYGEGCAIFTDGENNEITLVE